MIFIILIAVSFGLGVFFSDKVKCSQTLKKAEKSVLEFFSRRLDKLNGH